MQGHEKLDILSVTTTVGSLDAARTLAREILAQRLGACVQIDAGVTSLYFWQGQQQEEPEVRLVIKSLPGCEAALQSLFAQHHPYQVPQFLAQTLRASAAYAGWVRAETVVPATAAGPGH